MSHVDYKKTSCHPVDFKKTSCHPVDFKKTSCRPVEFKKTSCRMSLRPEKGRVAVSILRLNTPTLVPNQNWQGHHTITKFIRWHPSQVELVHVLR